MTEPVARIRIELLYFEPTIWRRVDVPLSSSLMMLHRIIQVAFGWTNSHLFEFRVGDRIYGRPHPPEWDDSSFKVYDAKHIRLRTLMDRGIRMFTYLYDFGDDWEHGISVMETRTGDPDIDYPSFVDGARRCPPENVGGTPGFERFLETIRDPSHEDHAELVKWHASIYGRPFDFNDIEPMRIRYGLGAIARRRRGPLRSHHRRRQNRTR